MFIENSSQLAEHRRNGSKFAEISVRETLAAARFARPEKTYATPRSEAIPPDLLDIRAI
jgi:hypothetical protein